MACTIDQIRVNLVTSPVGAKELRVTGRATNCPTNQVIVDSSVTNPSAPVVVDPQGRFRVSLPATQPVQCDDLIRVRVECDGNPTCFFQDTSLQVPCCSAKIVSVQGDVTLGQLTPNSIRVTGTLLGCYNDQVVVKITAIVAGTPTTIGQTPATAVDPYNGAFFINMQIPPNVTVSCDTEVTVEAWCAQDPTCRDMYRGPLDCLACPRAAVSYTAGTCSGQPPVQPITLNATISIPAGAKYTFQWDYGDGSPPGAPFLVDNTGGTGATQHNHLEPPHNYPPGSYIASLIFLGPPFECSNITLPITVQCLQCPNLTGSVSVGPCENPTSPNFGHRPVTYTLNFSPAIPQNAQVWVTWNYGGSTSTGATTLTQMIPTAAGPVALWTHQIYLKHKAGGYASSATVIVIHQGQACTPSNVQFAYPSATTPPLVQVGPCIACPDRVDLTRNSPATLPCAPTTSNLEFQASVVWPAGTPNPPNPSAYDWTITLPPKVGQPTRQAKYINGPAKVDTASGWTGNGATASGTVDLSDDGTYSIGVTAKYPTSAGLPTNADGTSQCNLTGSNNFTLPPCCPKFIGQLNVAQGSSPCEQLFSVQVDNPSEVQKFEWMLDGNPIPGNGASNSYTFSPGAITTHQVSATMTPKSPSCPKQSLSSTFIVNCPVAPPKVTGCSVTPGGSGAGSVRVTFDSDVDSASATTPANFNISIGGGPTQNPASGSLSYDSATRTTTITGLSINAGDTINVTVTGVKDATGTATISAQNTATCTASCPPGQHWDPSQGNCVPDTTDGTLQWPNWICAILLILALVALAVALVGAFIWGCALPASLTPGGAAVELWVIFLTIIAFAVFLVLIILWGIFCARSHCGVLCALITTVDWLIGIAAIALVILSLLGNPCLVGALFDGLLLGIALAVLIRIAQAVGCPIPVFPSFKCPS